jgi:O-antigen/teichoic acid export membrane protein
VNVPVQPRSKLTSEAETVHQSPALHGRLGNRGLGKRLLFGFGAQALTMLVEIAQSIFMVSLYLYAWGVRRYEDWLVIGAAAGFVRMFDLGMEFHFGNSLRLSLAAGDKDKFDRSLAIGMTCYGFIMLVICVGSSLLVLTVSVDEYLRHSAMTGSEAALVLWLSVIQRTILLPRPFIRSIYAAHGEFSRGENMFTIFSVGSAGTNAIMLLLGIDPIELAAISIVTALVFCWTIMIWDQRRRYPDVRYKPAVPTWQELRAAARNARYYTLPLWADQFLVQGPVLLISGFVREPGGILVFKLSRTLTGLARQGAIQLARSGGIEMARQIVQKDRAAAIGLHRTLGRTIGGLTGLSCGLILVTAEPLLDIWSGGRVAYDPLTVIAFVAGVMFAGPAQANTMLLQLSNVPRPLAISSILQVVFTMGLGLALIPWFGPLGAAVGVGMADAFAFAVVINYAAARKFGLKAENYAVVGYGAEFAGLALGAGGAWALMQLLPVHNIHAFAVLSMVWGALLAIPAFFLLLNTGQRSRVLERVGGFVRPGKLIQTK